MKRILFITLILFLLSGVFLFSNEKLSLFNKDRIHSIHQIKLPPVNLYASDSTNESREVNKNKKDVSKDEKKGNGEKKENIIMKDVKWDWFKSENRLEKILIALGAIITSIGVPFFLVGLVSILAPTNAVTSTFQNFNYTFIGVGSGLLGTAPSMIIVGAVRIKIRNKKKAAKKNGQKDNSDSHKEKVPDSSDSNNNPPNKVE